MMYNPLPSGRQNPANLQAVPNPSNPATDLANSSNALQRKNSRQSSSMPFWVWLVLFGGLYVAYEWVWEKKLSKEDMKLHFIMRFLLNMLGLFIGVVFVVNLGKIVVGKLAIWTKRFPFLNDIMHYIAIAVGNT